MWLNSTQREEPYQDLTYMEKPLETWVCLRTPYTGGARLSSARVVRCWVKSRNERNPCPMLPAVRPGTHRRLPRLTRRKVGMTSNHHAPYVLGCTRATMAGTTGCNGAILSESLKTGPSSDWSLQFDSMKLESLVIANQQRRGEYVPGSCTHRPSSDESWGYPKSFVQPQGGRRLR